MFLAFLPTPLLPIFSLLILPLVITYFLFFPYIHHHRTLHSIPGPFLAKLSNLWLLYQCRRGRRYLAVDAAHRKYGKFVRLQPNHVSVADAGAIGVVYGHGGGWVKSSYYDAFVSIHRGLFNTRSRSEHTRKRKTIAHTFSPKSVSQFEPFIAANLAQLLRQWDRICDEGEGEGEGEASASEDNGASGGLSSPADNSKYKEIDALPWLNYLSFDIIGDLAFGAPFGMLPSGADIATVTLSPTAPPTTAPAIQVLNRRGEVSATLGCMPWLKPYARWLPDGFFRNGVKAVEDLAGIAKARVGVRLALEEKEKEEEEGGKDTGEGNEGKKRKDLLARLMQGRDERGEPLGRDELTAEALTQLIAGGDTTSNTVTAGLYWILRTEGVLPRLQAEVDKAMMPSLSSHASSAEEKEADDGGIPRMRIPAFGQVKDLPYLKAVINETLRHHSTSSLGLPRVVPPGGATVCGRRFAAGTVLSVPAYTIHHDTKIWGEDAWEFRPERWLTRGLKGKDPEKVHEMNGVLGGNEWNEAKPSSSCSSTRQHKSPSPSHSGFIPFSTGPRACIGRNLAEMELFVIFATVVLNYDFELRQETLETREGFLRKPVGLKVGIARRRREGAKVGGNMEGWG